MLTTGVRELRDNLPAALRELEDGEARIVILRRSETAGALVPMPDLWFLVEIDEELRRRGFRPGSTVRAAHVVEAILELCPTRERVGPVPEQVIPRPSTLEERLGSPEMQERVAALREQCRALYRRQ